MVSPISVSTHGVQQSLTTDTVAGQRKVNTVTDQAEENLKPTQTVGQLKAPAARQLLPNAQVYEGVWGNDALAQQHVKVGVGVIVTGEQVVMQVAGNGARRKYAAFVQQQLEAIHFTVVRSDLRVFHQPLECILANDEFKLQVLLQSLERVPVCVPHQHARDTFIAVVDRLLVHAEN